MAGQWVERGSFKGPEGDSAYEIWLAAGNTGTESDYLAAIKGEPGLDATDAAQDDAALEGFILTDGTKTKAALSSTTASQIQAAVPPLVEQTLAADPTVANAAAVAVNDESFRTTTFRDTVQAATGAATAVNLVKASDPQSTTGSWGQNAGGATTSFQLAAGAGPYGGNAVTLTWTIAPATPLNTGIWVGEPTTDTIPVVAGVEYPFSVHVHTNSSRTLAVGLRFYDAAGGNVGDLLYGASTTVPANTWTRLEKVQTVPTGAVRARIYALVPAGAAGWTAGDVLKAGAASTAPAPYFNGGYPGAVWDGTAWQSPSRILRPASRNVFVGANPPQAPKGMEYVWFKTDGAGNTLDILTGIGA